MAGRVAGDIAELTFPPGVSSKPRQPHHAREKCLHQRGFPLLLGGDQLFDQLNRPVPRREDDGDPLLFGKRGDAQLERSNLVVIQSLSVSSCLELIDCSVSNRSVQIVHQVKGVQFSLGADDADVLVDIPIKKPIWHDRVSTNGCPSDVEQNIVWTHFGAGHAFVLIG